MAGKLADAESTSSKGLQALSEELVRLRARLHLGGGEKKIQRQHDQGKLTARERIEQLLDPGEAFLEIGLLVAYDQYDGQAPGAGVVTGVGVVEGREVVVVANDATVKAGSGGRRRSRRSSGRRRSRCGAGSRSSTWWIRPGVNLPYQGGVFPGQYGAAGSSTTTRSCGATCTCRR